MIRNIKDALEIVKRAGFGPDDKMKSSKSERRTADSQRCAEPELREEEKEPAFERLLEIDDL